MKEILRDNFDKLLLFCLLLICLMAGTTFVYWKVDPQSISWMIRLSDHIEGAFIALLTGDIARRRFEKKVDAEPRKELGS